jgi:hypothetical protein
MDKSTHPEQDLSKSSAMLPNSEASSDNGISEKDGEKARTHEFNEQTHYVPVKTIVTVC